MSLVLLTRHKGTCPKCDLLKSRLVGKMNTDCGLEDADSPDGMATALIYDIRTVPALIDGDEVITDLEEIIWRLTSPPAKPSVIPEAPIAQSD